MFWRTNRKRIESLERAIFGRHGDGSGWGGFPITDDDGAVKRKECLVGAFCVISTDHADEIRRLKARVDALQSDYDAFKGDHEWGDRVDEALSRILDHLAASASAKQADAESLSAYVRKVRRELFPEEAPSQAEVPGDDLAGK